MVEYLRHGEESEQDHLATVIRDKYGLDVSAPKDLEEIILGEKTEREKIRRPAPAPADEFDRRLGDLRTILDEADGSLEKLRALPAAERAALARLLNDAARHLDEA